MKQEVEQKCCLVRSTYLELGVVIGRVRLLGIICRLLVWCPLENCFTNTTSWH